MSLKSIAFLSLTAIFLTCSSPGEKGFIKGNSGEWLTDGKVKIRAIPIYRGKYLENLIIDLYNHQETDIRINWVSGNFSGKVHTWAPIYDPSSDEDLRIKSIIRTNGIDEGEIKERESELQYKQYILSPMDSCRTLFGNPQLGDNPKQVRITVQLADSIQSGPYIVKITEPN